MHIHSRRAMTIRTRKAENRNRWWALASLRWYTVWVGCKLLGVWFFLNDLFVTPALWIIGLLEMVVAKMADHATWITLLAFCHNYTRWLWRWLKASSMNYILCDILLRKFVSDFVNGSEIIWTKLIYFDPPPTTNHNPMIGRGIYGFDLCLLNLWFHSTNNMCRWDWE